MTTQLSLETIRRNRLGLLQEELKDLDLSSLDGKALGLSEEETALLEKARGNENRLFDESRFDGVKKAFGQTARGLISVGFSRRDEHAFIGTVVKALELHWGEAVTDLPLGDPSLPHLGPEFAIRKAAQMKRMGLTPSRVKDFFLEASGKVGGDDVKSQHIFCRHYSPDPAIATGKVVPLSPGFAETGRHFEMQIKEMLAKGFDVVVMDHQWAGHSDGEKGSFNSVAGLAKNVAAVCAYAQKIVDEKYDGKAGAEVVGFSNSMGALAMLYAAALNDNDDLKLGPMQLVADDKGPQTLDARQMPRNMKLMLQAPFLGLADGLDKKMIAWLGEIKAVNVAMPAMNVPKITGDEYAKRINAQEAKLESIFSNPQAMAKGVEGIGFLREYIESKVPGGEICFYSPRNDGLADWASSADFADTLSAKKGDAKVHFPWVSGWDHVVENDPDTFRQPLAMLEHLAHGRTQAEEAAELGRRLQGDAKVDVGWVLRNQPEPKDLTASFSDVMAAVKAGENQIPDTAKDMIFFHVPGLFTERYPGYFDSNIQRLKDKGLDARMSKIDTDASVTANAEVLKAEIEQLARENPGKKIMLLGHSKGGVDITATLGLHPELKEHVAGVISMQAPFGGTPIASDINDCPELLPLVSGAIKNLFRGDVHALTDLSYAARRAFLHDHPYPDDIPTFSLATSSESPWSLTAAASAYIKHRYGVLSDGLVAQRDAIIPGKNCYVIQDGHMDHAAPGMEGGDLTEALVTLALQNLS